MRWLGESLVSALFVLVVPLFLWNSPSAAVERGTFIDVKESVGQYDFINEVTLDPVDGGLWVSWTEGAQKGIRVGMSNGADVIGWISSQRVLASFDPITASGGVTCTPAHLEDRRCLLTGLKNGVQYAVQIRTVLGNDPSYMAQSDTPFTPFTAAPCCSVPLAPSGVTAVSEGDALDVSWTQPTDWGGAEELLYRVSTTPASTSCEVTVLACRLENVPRGVALTVNVTASNSAGESEVAGSRPVKIPVTVPDPPPVVTAKYPKPGAARVSWTVPLSDGGKPVTGYVVTASPSGKVCMTTNAHTCMITGLIGGKLYSFTVKAQNSMGSSTASSAGVAGVLVNPASAPRDAKASASGGAATVTWTKPAKSGGGKFVQYLVRVGTTTCTTKALSCTVTGLALGRTYPVSIVSINSAGRSRPAVTQVTTVAPVAIAPTGQSTSKPTQELS